MEENLSIQISLNKKQLKLLLRSLSTANTVRTCYQPGKVNESTKEAKMIGELLKHADALELGHWVSTDNPEELDEMKEMDIYEDIQNFEALAFWNILAEQMAERDMDEIYGEEQYMEMSIDEVLDKEEEFQEKYMEEFDENGLTNLRLINPLMN